MKNTLLLLALFLFSSSQSLFSQATGIIYFVFGSDSSTPGIGIRTKSAEYKSSGFDLFTAPDRNTAKVMAPDFRNRYKDSQGSPFKFTWWMQGGSLYRFAENTNVPYPSLMSLNLIQRYFGDEIKQAGDEFTYHYHTWVWSDYNGDGIYYWNQAPDYKDTREDFFVNLAEALIEEDMFPVSFRSGWHFMDNDWQADLDDFVPYSLHNAWPANARDTLEPLDNLYTWKDATSSFIPFQPLSDNYQLPGGTRGWNTRSVHFRSVTETMIRSIFEEAKKGQSQVPCIWSHVAEDTFISDFENVFAIIEKVAADYPEIEFHYDTAVESMKQYLELEDNTPPELIASEIPSGNGFKIQVQTNEAIFQRIPFVAVKTIFERHRQIELISMGANRWESYETFDSEIITAWSVALSDSAGNQSKHHEVRVPKDIYLDDESPYFSYPVTTPSWTNLPNTELQQIWGRQVQTAVLQKGESISARWFTEIQKDQIYSTFVRIPLGLEVEDSVLYTVSLNNEVIYSAPLNEVRYNEWLFLCDVDAKQTDELAIEISRTATKANERIIADGVKISAYRKPVWITSNQIELNLGLQQIGIPVQTAAELENHGFQTAEITGVRSVNNLILPDISLPFQIAPHGFESVELSFTPSKYGKLIDTLIFSTNDMFNAEIRIPVSATVKDYFELSDNDLSPETYKESGTWSTSVAVASGKTSRYAFVTNANKDAKVSFSSTLEKPGYYAVLFIVPSATNSALRARYSVFVNGELQFERILNQNYAVNTWRSIGMIYTDAQSDIEVILDLPDVESDQAGKVLRADAVLFERIGLELSEIIIDNEDSNYSENGTWSTSTAQAFGSSSRYTGYGSKASATYSFTALADGVHQLNMIVPTTVNASEFARYTVLINGFQQDQVIVNQNTNSGTWVAIGNWYADKGASISVLIDDGATVNTNKVLRTDAIKWLYGNLNTTSVDESNFSEKWSFELFPNYPNPFNPSTTISFSLNKPSIVSLRVFDVTGRQVKSLVNEFKLSGTHFITWNASGLASGVYIVQLQTDKGLLTQKILLLK